MSGTLHTAVVKAIGSAVTGTANRTIGDHLTDIINVKDFDAVGDGSTDDTDAIQRAFDAAFGSVDSPHGNNNKKLNRPVYIPGGRYIVSAPTALTISAAANNGSGLIRLTVSTIANFGTASQAYKTGQMVLIAGITGTIANAIDWDNFSAGGSAINGYAGITVINSTHIDLSLAYYGGSYTSGGTAKRAALNVRSLRGGWIFGNSRESTILHCATSGAALLSSNGMDYSRIDGIGFSITGNGVAFDFNWDNTSSGGSVALQATTIANCTFGGDTNTLGVGLQIGLGGYQCSELVLINNHMGSIGTGLFVNNFNALQVQLLGGNYQDCAIGIHVGSGSVPAIIGVGFQVNTQDILIEGGTFADATFVVGCRTESANFFKSTLGINNTLVACGQTGTAGKFAEIVGSLTMIGCHSYAGTVENMTGNGGALYGMSNTFGQFANAVPSWSGQNEANVTRALMSGFDAYYWNADSTGNMYHGVFSRLPAASARTLGAIMPVYDSTTATIDATITGGGSNKVLAYSTNSAWKVLKAL